MNISRFLATIIIGTSLCLLGYQSAFAQGQGKGDPHPDSSVEGRTYCFTLNLLIMSGIGVGQSEQLTSGVIRRTATFTDTMFTGFLDSQVRNTQADNGTVTQATTGVSPNVLMGTYTQDGSKLNMNLPQISITPTWYVSKDGSLIYGTSITQSGPFGPNIVTVGVTRNWTLVEIDPDAGETCAGEL